MDKKLIFYDITWYNYPPDKNYFALAEELTENIKHSPKIEKKLSSNTEKLEKIINKYKFLYKQIPFIHSIYVCNSLSFKSIHENSDIDLFIVCKNNRIFLAKFFTWLFFKIFWLWWNHEKEKFCCGFFVTQQAQDLYPISIWPVDLYLAYWIAHLQPLYSENWVKEIYKENLWVKQIIPNYQLKEKKILNINFSKWKWFIKSILEKLFGFDFLNSIVGFFWKKKMNRTKKKLWKKWENIIISDNILKFHAPDKRKIIYLRYKSLKTENKKSFKKHEEKTIF